jgi:hypothetical protein
MNPKDRSAASTFSRIVNSIVASFLSALGGNSPWCGGHRTDATKAMRRMCRLPREKVIALREQGGFVGELDQTPIKADPCATGV